MKTIMKTGWAVVIVGFFANFLFGGGTDNEADIPALIQGGALVVDVRSPNEFSSGHINGAINIPHNAISREIENIAPDKDRTIILYCHSGGRAAAAKKALVQAGYTHVVNASTLRNMRAIIEQK